MATQGWSLPFGLNLRRRSIAQGCNGQERTESDMRVETGNVCYPGSPRVRCRAASRMSVVITDRRAVAESLSTSILVPHALRPSRRLDSLRSALLSTAPRPSRRRRIAASGALGRRPPDQCRSARTLPSCQSHPYSMSPPRTPHGPTATILDSHSISRPSRYSPPWGIWAFGFSIRTSA